MLLEMLSRWPRYLSQGPSHGSLVPMLGMGGNELLTGHGDVVGGGLALGLDEDGAVDSVLAVPGLEGREDLETVGGRGDLDADGGTVLGGGLVGVLASIVTLGRETIAGGGSEHELVAVLVLELVGHGVEAKGASNGHGDDEIGGSDEGVGGGVALRKAGQLATSGSMVGRGRCAYVSATGEVAVVRSDDRVGNALLDVTAIPLANAGSAGVGKNGTTELLKGAELAITGSGGTDLLRAGGDEEGRLGLDAVVEGITGDGGATRHILVRGVGARADQTSLELNGPVVVLDGLGELGEGSGKIGGEGAVDVGLELGEVDLDDLVVLGTLIGAELVGVGTGKVTDVLAASGLEVVVLAVAEGEDGGGGTNLGTLVTVSVIFRGNMIEWLARTMLQQVAMPVALRV